MKVQRSFLAVPMIAMLNLWPGFAGTLPEPGPEDGGLRMRLVVIPHTAAGKEGYEVRVDVLNLSRRAITLRAGWRDNDEGDVKDYIEAATSIESVPAILPWMGGVEARRRTQPQPEHLLKAGDVLSVGWWTEGRHLKNRVTDPNQVQNPEFPFAGLYSVHATLDILAGDRLVALRSNEQLVAVGGSRSMPKHTYGQLSEVDAGGKTAVLQLGSRHHVEVGDEFIHYSKQTPWKLTLTKVARDHSWGHIELLSPNTERLPRPGMGATLIMTK